MKTSSAFTEAAIDNPYVDVVRLVEITVGAKTLYFCDRVFGDDKLCTFNGRLYEPLIISWGTIKTGRIDPATSAVEPGSASFTIDNSQPVGGAECFTALFADNDPQYCSTIISEIYEGASAAEDKEDIFGGHIEDLPEMTVDRVTVACGGFELDIVNRFIHTIVDHTTYPGADPDDIGKMVPQIYGQVKRVPCIAADAGGKTTIAEDMTDTSPGNSGTLDVSDASALPASGAFTTQIDSEQVRIASRSGNTLTLASSGARGYNSTTAVAHDLGAPMAEIQTKYVYLLADHPVKEITTVYVDGIRQTSGFTAYTGQTGSEYTGYEGKAVIVFDALPLYKKQINIEADSSSLDANDIGHNHTTAQQTIDWFFDNATVTDPVISNVANICDESLSSYANFEYDSQCKVEKSADEQYSGPPQGYRIAMRVGTIQTGLTITATFYGLTGLYGVGATSANNGTTVYSGWFTVDGNTNTWTKLRTQPYVPMYVTSTGVNTGTIAEVWLEVKYTPAGTPSGYANVSMSGGVTLTGNSTAETVIGNLIAADLKGYLDDGSGTYTGTPDALIERPDHQSKHIIIDRCGLSTDEIHAASYSAAGTFFNTNSFTLGFPILQRPNVRLLLNRIAIQARSLEFWEAGLHHLVHIPDPYTEDELSVLLLHMDGTDGSTVFTDDGVTGHTVTPHGNCEIDTAFKRFGTGSGLFGPGDYLSIPDHANFNMASGRVAIDVWKRFQSVDQTAVLYSQFVDNTHFVKLVVHYDIISFHIKNGSDVINFSRVYTGGFTAGTQYHFALIRGWNNNDNTWAITVNGQIVGNTYSNSAAWPDFAASVLIGKTGDWSKLANPTVLPAGGGATVFNHNGSLLAVTHGSSPYITIYNTSDWSKVTNPATLPAGGGRDAAFNHDGSLLAVAHLVSPYITIYNTSDWSKITDPATLPPSVGYGTAFNHDGSLLAVTHDSSPYITIYNTSDWSKVTDPTTLPANTGYGVAFNHDGSLMAVAHNTSPYITIYNTSDWSKVTNPATLPTGGGRDAAFNHDGSLLAVTHQTSPYITIYNTSDWSKVSDPATLPTVNGVRVTFSHDGSSLAVAHLVSPYITIYNTSDWSKITDPATLPTATGAGAAFNHDGSLLAVSYHDFPYVNIYVPIQYSKGHKDEYRVSKTTARWTADFTPSDKPYPNTDPGGGMIFNLTLNKSIDDNRVDLGQIWLKYTDRINIKNKLTARYSRQWSGHIDEVEADRAIVIASDADSITKFGTLQGNPFSYPYVNSETQTQAVLNLKLSDSKASRLIVEQAGGYYTSDIERGDVIRFDNAEVINGSDEWLKAALLGLVTMGSTIFRVIDKNYRPDATIQIEAVIII